MKIQYASDLHLERISNYNYVKGNSLKLIPTVGEVLILAGDITKFDPLHYNDDFFKDLGERFDKVFVIPGNHEYWNITNLKLIEQETINIEFFPNVYFVNNVSIIHKDVKFIFSTFWSEIDESKRIIMQNNFPDFIDIKYSYGKCLTVDKYNELHLYSKHFILNELKNNKTDKVVIATHHLPTEQVVSEKYKGTTLTTAFYSEQEDMIKNNKISCWIYGHSHENIPDIEIEDTILTCNQLGYYFNTENKSFIPGKIVEI